MRPTTSPYPGRLFDEGMHRLARRHVDGRDARLVARVAHHLRCRVGVGLAAVGEHHVLPDADPACDRVTYLARSNHNDDVSHGIPCHSGLFTPMLWRTWTSGFSASFTIRSARPRIRTWLIARHAPAGAPGTCRHGS